MTIRMFAARAQQRDAQMRHYFSEQRDAKERRRRGARYAHAQRGAEAVSAAAVGRQAVFFMSARKQEILRAMPARSHAAVIRQCPIFAVTMVPFRF